MSKSFSEYSRGDRSLPLLLLTGWAEPCPSPTLGDPFDSAAAASADFALTGINLEMVLIRAAASEEIPPIRDRRSAAGDSPFEDRDRHLHHLPPFHRRQTGRGSPWVDPRRKEDLAGVDISDPGDQPLIHQKRFHREPPRPGDLPKTARRKPSERIFHKRRGALHRLHGEGRKPARINEDKRSGGKKDHQTAVSKKKGAAPDSSGTVQRFFPSSPTDPGEQEYAAFRQRDLSRREYVYVWVDGVHFNIRLEDDRLCALVLIGARADGEKELLAVEDGYRESAESWKTLLRDLKRRGMVAPAVAVGDGALGFWAAVREVWPESREQACWCHKLANVLDKLPVRFCTGG